MILHEGALGPTCAGPQCNDVPEEWCLRAMTSHPLSTLYQYISIVEEDAWRSAVGAIVILAVAARGDAWLLRNRYGRDDGVVPFVGVDG